MSSNKRKENINSAAANIEMPKRSDSPNSITASKDTTDDGDSIDDNSTTLSASPKSATIKTDKEKVDENSSNIDSQSTNETKTKTKKRIGVDDGAQNIDDGIDDAEVNSSGVMNDAEEGKENQSETKSKKRASAGTTSALKTTYLQLCHDAIVSMGDRTGSSLAAIKKWILTQHPDLIGPHFNSRVNIALKNGLSKKQFDKVKASFKISSAYKEAERMKRRKTAAHVAKVQKEKDNKAKAEQLIENEATKKMEDEEKRRNMSPQDRERLAREDAAKVEAVKRRAAAEARAKIISERIRKRRFPMEDTKLHAEDKEFGVKAPSDVASRPVLPCFWNITVPSTDKGRTVKTSTSVLAASKADGLDFGSRGLVNDMLQVYHFFRGDVHFALSADSTPIVAQFSLQQLIHATEQILNGNVRKTKLVPPLICHLFVCCLQVLWQEPPTFENSEHLLSKNERQLREDFHKFLLPYLTPVSWPDLCFLYMDAMERHFTTDASIDLSVLQPFPIDVEYLLGATNEVRVPETPHRKTETSRTSEGEIQLDNVHPGNVDSSPLPDGYMGYLGDPRGALCRAHHKLYKQDPWNLTAEELMAILRALTDDVLALHPAAAADIAARDEKMSELLKAKKAAEYKFRKMRLAFEGPRRPSKKSTARESDKRSDLKENCDHNGADPEDGGSDKEENQGSDDKIPFKPTVSKNQFEAARKAQEKANDAYEKGIRTYASRTEPIGYDRNFNAIYCFRHDPEVLYVEERRPPSGLNSHFPNAVLVPRFSWHYISTTSLFDMFTASLDIRGKREFDLYDELVGPPGSHRSLRRFLYDDVKEQQIARANIKERESLLERLRIANIKCDEEKGRRSGRIAGNVESELLAIQAEIDALEKTATGKTETPPKDFAHLLGTDVLITFERSSTMETRRSREKKGNATRTARSLPLISCSKLISTGNIDGTGLVGMIVAELLELEESCESLISWDKGDAARQSWITRLEEAVMCWSTMSSDLETVLEGEEASTAVIHRRESLGDNSCSKRRKSDISTGANASAVIALLKHPILELEERLADVTNVSVATRDTYLADENMSDNEADDEADKKRSENAWKKMVRKIRDTPTKSFLPIREQLVASISAARKAHLSDVVTKLRAALLLWHPNAAGDCKAAAVKVLVEYGDIEEDFGSESDEEDDADNTEVPPTSALCAEAVILKSCLGGTDGASRADWISAVKTVKTLSRLAALAASLTKCGKEKIAKLRGERDSLDNAITIWSRELDRRQKKNQSGKTATESDFVGPSEVWAKVEVTDEICMAKAEQYPWWPAKKCKAKDPKLASSLESLDRCLVALIGEMGGLRVVKIKQTKEFTGKRIEGPDDLADQSKEMKQQLDDCLGIARRIQRGRLKTKKK